ncbi:hypothetical protein B0H17DRAFT_1200185 [Mycena rosella]|uniref:Uncharacterized protein n=1 Tax=Mycena rosella TaxID=1033263 RepID=A0AAD7GFY3_MYCRO|nr:hypothetical protein B0H17DRAFT_1200185 [Mycena rosella]
MPCDHHHMHRPFRALDRPTYYVYVVQAQAPDPSSPRFSAASTVGDFYGDAPPPPPSVGSFDRAPAKLTP